MYRFQVLGISLVVTIFSIFLLANDVSSTDSQAFNKEKSPNMLFIMSDDQDLLMDSMDYMPKVHSLLAAKGTTFSKHYCTSSLCCPSRISLFTGKCVHNTNVTDVKVPYGAYPKFISQGLNNDYLPLWLQAGSINTYYVGKFSNGHNVQNHQKNPAQGWTSSNFLLDPGMYDYTNTTWTLNNQHYQSFPGENSIDIITKNALSMLDTAVKGGKPFFMTVAPAVPHVGINASAKGETFFPIPQTKWANAFSDKIFPRTPNWNNPIEASGASWLLNLPHQNKSVVDGLDELYRRRIRCVAGLDDMVGDLVAALEDYGILEDTHIIYTADNGYHIGQHRMGPGKKQGCETDINVPMVWRGPGVPAGKVTSEVSTHTDLAPTFLSIFGLHQRNNTDGQIMPVINNKHGKQSGEHVNVELWGTANPYEVEPYSDITIPGQDNNTYKAVRIIAPQYSFYYSVWCDNEHELYNMLKDPYQMDNLLARTTDITQAPGILLLKRPLDKLVTRLDALPMILKTCVGMQYALNPRYDTFYNSQPKVSFSLCALGYLKEYEGPQTALVYSGF
ncbi:alkaline-phosphatase-like protein [Xylogone sp. PMI_703]|nr:alkaline-phosphatase-like protein [Xylogone sp. PMI_703]